MSKISIIIPIYNVEQYVERCFDSLLAQTHTDYEIVCIDDGSKDSSGAICDRYSQKDSRIRVFHIPNGGVSHARNYALERITGEWFCFIDADDWVEPDYLEKLLKNAIDNQCDVSACGFVQSGSYSLCEQQDAEKLVTFITKEERIQAYIQSGVCGMVWNKLYRSSVLKEIMFDTDYKVNEDCLYTQKVMERSSAVCLTNQKLYHWFYREDSACHTKKMKCDFKPAEVFLILLEKNQALQKEEINRKLKSNYVSFAVNIMLHADCREDEEACNKARKLCRQWKKEINGLLSTEEKIKYFIVMDCPWLKGIFLKARQKLKG